jgi:NADPH-dependent 2,4-dienoyl-CoA reductase/sulfur reductase-like enzyme
MLEVNPLRYLIVGSGPAGVFAAEAIRTLDQEGSVIMISADDHPARSPVMTTYWMTGHLSQERLFFRDPGWADKIGIDFRCGIKAVSLDSRSRKVRLSDGDEILYDRLLIATGASPISLPIPGMNLRGVASIRNQRDAESILQEQSGLREIAIIGGGFVGLKLACHLKERGLQVTVLEKEPWLAARMFDLKASRVVEKRLKACGVRIETGVEVVQVLNQSGWVSGVEMKDGRFLSCRTVVVAVGVRPNVAFLQGSGVELKGGVLVDQRMVTNIPTVFAAGDVTVTKDSISTDWVNNATWPAATRQGKVAGSNMTGGDQRYLHNFNLNAVNLFGLKVMAAGNPSLAGQFGIEVLVNEERESYRQLSLREGRLIGFIFVGDVSGAGALLSLMKRGVGRTKHEWDDLLSSWTPPYDLPAQLGFDHGYWFQNRLKGKGRSLDLDLKHTENDLKEIS